MRGRVLGDGNDIGSECEPIEEPAWSRPAAYSIAAVACIAFWGLVTTHLGWLPVIAVALFVIAIVLTK